jgi:hypothetical protein
MKFSRFFPWFFALVWLALRYILGQSIAIDEARTTGILTNILFLLTVIFLSMWFYYRQRPAPVTGFLEDVKRCMRDASKYVIGVAGGLALYYGVLTDDIEQFRNVQMKARLEEIATDAGMKNYLIKTNSDPSMTRAAVENAIVQDVNNQITIGKQISFGIPLLLVAAIFYTLLTVVFWRQVLMK